MVNRANIPGAWGLFNARLSLGWMLLGGQQQIQYNKILIE
jgi:hypothetical protein